MTSSTCNSYIEQNYTFQQWSQSKIEGVAMGSPLEPVLVGVFIVEHERTFLPTSSQCKTL